MLGFGEVASLIETVVERIWPDATEAEKAKLAEVSQRLTQEFQLKLEQIKLNTAEAQSGSVFVAGWRPFLGWVCGFGLAYQWILRPLATPFMALAGLPVLPVLDLGDLITLVVGMLGMGTLRTAEKIKGVERSKLK